MMPEEAALSTFPKVNLSFLYRGLVDRFAQAFSANLYFEHADEASIPDFEFMNG